jgi:hypothetical protein
VSSWRPIVLAFLTGLLIGWFLVVAGVMRLHTAQDLRDFQCGLTLTCVTPHG